MSPSNMYVWEEIIFTSPISGSIVVAHKSIFTIYTIILFWNSKCEASIILNAYYILYDWLDKMYHTFLFHVGILESMGFWSKAACQLAKKLCLRQYHTNMLSTGIKKRHMSMNTYTKWILHTLPTDVCLWNPTLSMMMVNITFM